MYLFHHSGGWEVQDHSAGKVGFSLKFLLWACRWYFLLNTLCPLLHAYIGAWRGQHSGISSYKGTNPTRTPTLLLYLALITSQRILPKHHHIEG